MLTLPSIKYRPNPMTWKITKRHIKLRPAGLIIHKHTARVHNFEMTIHSYICSVVDIILKFWQHISAKLTTSPPSISWKMGTCWLLIWICFWGDRERVHEPQHYYSSQGRIVPRTSLDRGKEQWFSILEPYSLRLLMTDHPE